MTNHKCLEDLVVGYSIADDGSRVSLSPKCARDRIASDRHQIHLFIWLHRVPNEEYNRFLFWGRHDEQTERLRVLFERPVSGVVKI